MISSSAVPQFENHCSPKIALAYISAYSLIELMGKGGQDLQQVQ